MPNVTKPVPIDESSDVVHDDTTGGVDGNPHSLSAELDDTGVLRAGQVPNLAITNTFTVTAESDLAALDAEEGDVGIVTDQSQAYILTSSDPTTLANWSVIQTPPAPVDDVFGRTGSVDPQSGDYSASEIANFASSALSAINGEIDATATSVAGLDDATNSHIGASNPHAGSADTNHGNEAHSSTFAVDGATQPPENHGNGAHSESYITSAEAPVQSVNGETGDVSINARSWETLAVQTTKDGTIPNVSNYEFVEIDFLFYTSENTSFTSEIEVFGPPFETAQVCRLWSESTASSSPIPVVGTFRGTVFTEPQNIHVAFRGEAYAGDISNGVGGEEGLLVITDSVNDCRIQMNNIDTNEEIKVVTRGYS